MYQILGQSDYKIKTNSTRKRWEVTDDSRENKNTVQEMQKPGHGSISGRLFLPVQVLSVNWVW